MIRHTRAAGVRPVFVTQPELWKDGLSQESQDTLWFGMISEDTAVEIPQLAKVIREFDLALMGVCREEDVGCIDLAPLSGDEPLFYADSRYTEAGARAVATMIADWFADRL